MPTNARQFLGRQVEGVMDRPKGSRYPRFGFADTANYGYLPGAVAPDGHEPDAWYLGVDEPVERAVGRCIAVIHRLDDDDDKLVVVPDEAMTLTDAEILRQTAFVEQHYQSVMLRDRDGWPPQTDSRRESTSEDEA